MDGRLAAVCRGRLRDGAVRDCGCTVRVIPLCGKIPSISRWLAGYYCSCVVCMWCFVHELLFLCCVYVVLCARAIGVVLCVCGALCTSYCSCVVCMWCFVHELLFLCCVYVVLCADLCAPLYICGALCRLVHLCTYVVLCADLCAPLYICGNARVACRLTVENRLQARCVWSFTCSV